jgi:uncharacterized protein
MEIFDQAQASLKERAAEIASLKSDREARLEGFDEQSHTQSDRLAAGRAERERVFNALPKSMSSLYTRISARIRDGVAVAEARNGACSACFMTLRPQVMAEVRRGEEVITCDNCNRILYAGSTDTAPNTSSTSTSLDLPQPDKSTAPPKRPSISRRI